MEEAIRRMTGLRPVRRGAEIAHEWPMPTWYAACWCLVALLVFAWAAWACMCAHGVDQLALSGSVMAGR